MLVIPFAVAHAANSIHITEQGFEPTMLEIQVGESVIFENFGADAHWPASNDHPTHEVYSEFDPKEPIKPGETWNFTFEEPGNWEFHDHLSPQNTGTITVIGKQNILQKAISYLKAKIARLFTADNTNDSSHNETCGKSDIDCIKHLLQETTAAQGPRQALQTLHTLQREGNISLALDDHELAHEIGRTSAKTFGTNAEEFFNCGIDFDYGCQHGFFEYTLGKTATSTEAINLICDTINETYPVHFKYRCYHGAGHGVMMAQAYELNKTLQICDTLSTAIAQDGCWQGSLMENTNAIMKNRARAGYFSLSDPLIPCTQIEEKYRFECFYNQAPWIIKYNKYDVKNASDYCLKTPAAYHSICVRGLALTLTSAKWHSLVIPQWNESRFIENAWQVCTQFPENHTTDCIFGAVSNILNFDETNITRAAEFCKITKQQQNCYTEVGRNAAYRTTNKKEIIEECRQLDKPAQDYCIKGAG